MPLGLKSFPGVAEQGFRGGKGSGSDPNRSFLSILSIKFLTHWVLRRKGAGHIGLSLWVYAPGNKGEVHDMSTPVSSGSKALLSPPISGPGYPGRKEE